MLDDFRGERIPLFGHQDILEGAVRELKRGTDFEDFCFVLGDAYVVFLEVDRADLKIGWHDDSGIGAVNTSLPRAFGAGEHTIFIVARRFAEVPDVAVLILREPVERIFCQLTIFITAVRTVVKIG